MRFVDILKWLNQFGEFGQHKDFMPHIGREHRLSHRFISETAAGFLPRLVIMSTGVIRPAARSRIHPARL
jgi:hypothetical protein